MVWYFIFPHYMDEYTTHLNVNEPNNYKSIHNMYKQRHKIKNVD